MLKWLQKLFGIDGDYIPFDRTGLKISREEFNQAWLELEGEITVQGFVTKGERFLCLKSGTKEYEVIIPDDFRDKENFESQVNRGPGPDGTFFIYRCICVADVVDYIRSGKAKLPDHSYWLASWTPKGY